MANPEAHLENFERGCEREKFLVFRKKPLEKAEIESEGEGTLQLIQKCKILQRNYSKIATNSNLNGGAVAPIASLRSASALTGRILSRSSTSNPHIVTLEMTLVPT